MAYKNDVKLSMLYADGTTRSYTFEGVADSVISGVAAKVKAVNADNNNNFHQTFVSNDGSAVLRIASAEVTTTEDIVIYEG